MLIVDTHTHVIIKDDPRYPNYHEIDMPWFYTHAVNMEQLLPMMENAGVEKAALVQGLTGHGYDNRYTADCAARFPGRFVAVGSFDAGAAGAVENLRAQVKELNIRGCRILPRNYRLTDANVLEVFKAAADLGIPMVMQGVRLKGLDDLKEAMTKVPDARVQLDHVAMIEPNDGPPFEAEKDLFSLASYANFYMKWSTNIINDTQKEEHLIALFEKMIAEFGSDRLLWGSNYPRHHEPEWSYKDCVDGALKLAANFSQKDQEMMLGGAALAVWPELKG